MKREAPSIPETAFLTVRSSPSSLIRRQNSIVDGKRCRQRSPLEMNYARTEGTRCAQRTCTIRKLRYDKTVKYSVLVSDTFVELRELRARVRAF